MDVFCSYGGGQTVELWNCSVVMVVVRVKILDLLCSYDGGQTVELSNSSVVMVGRL